MNFFCKLMALGRVHALNVVALAMMCAWMQPLIDALAQSSSSPSDSRSGRSGSSAGQAGSTGSGQTGSTGSGQSGSTGSGQTGSTGSGQSGSTGSGQTGLTGSGQTGSTGSGQTGSTGSGQTGSTGSGQTGSTGSGQTRSLGASPYCARSSAQSPAVILVRQAVRPLPGKLDTVPVVNSNSPEVVQSEGILVSTFPAAGKATPAAHLDKSFRGRFDIFAHHIARADKPDDLRTLYLGVILQNLSPRPVKVDVLTAASYLSQPDAPFVAVPPLVDNSDGKVFAGPGDRVSNEVLRNLRQPEYPPQIVIAPQSTALLANLPIPVRQLTPPLNGRSFLAKMNSSGPVYVATAAMFAPAAADGSESAPTIEQWKDLLQRGDLAGPREKPPTIPGAPGAVVYGRVAAVATGSSWIGRAIDENGSGGWLSLPDAGSQVSFPLSTVERGTLGTKQIQSAPLVVREPGTACAAHGNYGIKYDITFPLKNTSSKKSIVQLLLQCPLKDEDASALSFNSEVSKRVFFRGTLRISTAGKNVSSCHYKHVVLHQGEPGQPLWQSELSPGERVNVRLELIYPPDATPPQVVTIRTVSST